MIRIEHVKWFFLQWDESNGQLRYSMVGAQNKAIPVGERRTKAAQAMGCVRSACEELKLLPGTYVFKTDDRVYQQYFVVSVDAETVAESRVIPVGQEAEPFDGLG